MKKINIRPAVSSDITTLMAFDHGYSTNHVWQLSYDNESSQISVTFREVRLPRSMRVSYPRDPERLADEWTLRSALLLAEEDERPIGYVAIGEGPAENSGWILDLVVDLVHRRQSVATSLIASALDWCRQRGFDRLFIEMQSKNYPAISLARKSGFSFSGYSDQYYPDQDIVLFFSLGINRGN